MKKTINKKTLKVVISGYYGFNNFGDEAVLSVLVNSLKNLDVKDITVFSVNPNSTAETYNVKSCKTFNIFKVFYNIITADILFSGGGSLLQDVTSVKSLIYYLSIIFIAVMFRKKVIIFAQGIGPIKNRLMKNITSVILKKCTFISTRDEKSLSLLKNWGLSPILVSDPVWNISLKTKYSHRGIGIQLRQWHFLTDDILRFLAKYVADVYFDKQIFIYALQESLDLEICNKFEVFLKEINPDLHTHVILNRATFEIVESFSHLDELIAMRFHACLLGLKYRIKVLPIIYDPKVEKLADEFGIKNKLYLQSENEIESKIKNLRYGNYQVDEERLSEKQFNFKPFEEILFS